MAYCNCVVHFLHKHKPCLFMILVQLAYAGMSLLSKASIANGMNSFVFVAYRQAFATLALAPFAFFFDRKKADPMTYGLIFKIFLISMFGVSLSMNLYAYSMNYISATFASASLNTIPALTFVIAVVFGFESFSTIKIVGSTISLSGAMVFAFVKGPRLDWLSGNSISHTKEKSTVEGCLLMLSANAVWAGWFVMQASLVKMYPAKIRLTMLQCLFSFVQTSIGAMCVDFKGVVSSWRIGWDLGLLSVVYCGVVVTGISYTLQLWVVERKGPLYGASFMPLTLVFTAIASACVWKEVLCLGSVCGGVLVVVGLYCVIWGKNQEQEQEQEAQKEVLEETTNSIV